MRTAYYTWYLELIPVLTQGVKDYFVAEPELIEKVDYHGYEIETAPLVMDRYIPYHALYSNLNGEAPCEIKITDMPMVSSLGVLELILKYSDGANHKYAVLNTKGHTGFPRQSVSNETIELNGKFALIAHRLAVPDGSEELIVKGLVDFTVTVTTVAITATEYSVAVRGKSNPLHITVNDREAEIVGFRLHSITERKAERK